MRVISNTSPVLNLAIIGQSGLLRQQFSQVWIPVAVRDELCPDEERPGSAAIRDALAAGWLQVEPVMDHLLVNALARELDRGEAEAITLALQSGAERILLDERDARRVARSYGLEPTGVLGVLLRARREGNLASLSEAIDALRDRAGFHLASGLVAQVLAEADQFTL